MNEVIIHLANLVEDNKLSHKESEIFLDYAHDLVLDGNNDEEIEFRVKSEIKQILKEKENAELF